MALARSQVELESNKKVAEQNREKINKSEEDGRSTIKGSTVRVVKGRLI
jgi:hypothetical protein